MGLHGENNDVGNDGDGRSRNTLLQSWKSKTSGIDSHADGGVGVVRSNSGHKRSLSGGLLSKLSFLRFGRDEDTSSPSSPSTWQKKAGVSDYGLDGTPGSNASDHDRKQEKARKRKGSLRKTALLGTKNARVDAQSSKAINQNAVSDQGIRDERPLEMGTASIPEAEFAHMQSSPPLDVMNTSPPLPSNGTRHDMSDGSLLRSRPLGSPPSGELSTTDEDDFGGLAYQSLAPPHAALHPRGLTSESSISSFPSNTSLPLTRRHTGKRPKSPLSASPARSPATPEEWDYSETEWWGWVVLVVTWIVFVVGMGSCLGVWSWAWDVGETPYAPPELEDDPTLPIVGYYPALIILTMVMAWVWVVVAWVGMKYFRHAKISGEDI